ncbi:MAG: hypothetical protein IJ174_08085, partial [Clostridia bacterium]|nr:hypothetical protein [Clostridia bacterium]
GTVGVLTAHIEGVEEGYKLQWQYTPDGGVTIYDIEGADETVYRYLLNEETGTYSWRVRLTMQPEADTPEAEAE